MKDRKHVKLSPEAEAARRPLPPGELVGALQDRVHRDPGRARAARTTKSPMHEAAPTPEQRKRWAEMCRERRDWKLDLAATAYDRRDPELQAEYEAEAAEWAALADFLEGGGR